MMLRQGLSLKYRVGQAVIYCLPFLFFSLPLLAEAPKPSQNLASTSSMMMQVTLGLVVVIALMLILAWLAKRLRLVPGGSHHQALKVMAVLPLTNRERLVLVQVGEEQLLLGVTSNQINCLHQLEKPLSMNTASGQAGFAQLLNQWKTAPANRTVTSKDSKHEG